MSRKEVKGWNRVCPPSNRDVILPAWMADKYRLYMPDRDCDGAPVDWDFKYCRSAVEPETPPSRVVDRCPVTCRCGCQDMSRCCCGVQMLECPPPRQVCHSKIAARAEPLKSAVMQDQGEELGFNQLHQTDKPWRVFYADDPGDPHTVICINKILVECRPKLRPHVFEMPLRDWNDAATYHKDCTSVGKHNSALQDCYVAYTDTRPMTHAWVDGVAIHFDDLVKLTFTPAATKQ